MWIGGGLAGALALVVFGAGLMVIRRPAAEYHHADTPVIGPAGVKLVPIPVGRGTYTYTLIVEALDGRVQASIGGLSRAADPDEKEVDRLIWALGKDGVIEKGESRQYTGRIEDLHPIWLIFNLEHDRSVRARVKVDLGPG